MFGTLVRQVEISRMCSRVSIWWPSPSVVWRYWPVLLRCRELAEAGCEPRGCRSLQSRKGESGMWTLMTVTIIVVAWSPFPEQLGWLHWMLQSRSPTVGLACLINPCHLQWIILHLACLSAMAFPCYLWSATRFNTLSTITTYSSFFESFFYVLNTMESSQPYCCTLWHNDCIPCFQHLPLFNALTPFIHLSIFFSAWLCHFLYRPPNIYVGRLMFYHGFLFLFFLRFFICPFIYKFAERNSTIYMVRSKCDLKMHVRNVGIPSPTNRPPKKHFWRFSNLGPL